ncbi:MAG: AAA family ATPase, partial [Stellaceae bacterium]
MRDQIVRIEDYNSPAALWLDDDEWDEADIPCRPWLAPGFALRGAVSLLVGAPSAMKSSLMLGWAAAVALKHGYGRFQPAGSGGVIVYNIEDDKNEQRRRLSAVLRQFNATPRDVKGQLIRIGPSNIGTLFVRDAATGKITATAAMDELRTLIAERAPAMLIADPLAELHTAEENDNQALRAVIAEFRALAVEFQIAVILIHHTRKGIV